MKILSKQSNPRSKPQRSRQTYKRNKPILQSKQNEVNPKTTFESLPKEEDLPKKSEANNFILTSNKNTAKKITLVQPSPKNKKHQINLIHTKIQKKNKQLKEEDAEAKNKTKNSTKSKKPSSLNQSIDKLTTSLMISACKPTLSITTKSFLSKE